MSLLSRTIPWCQVSPPNPVPWTVSYLTPLLTPDRPYSSPSPTHLGFDPHPYCTRVPSSPSSSSTGVGSPYWTLSFEAVPTPPRSDHLSSLFIVCSRLVPWSRVCGDLFFLRGRSWGLRLFPDTVRTVRVCTGKTGPVFHLDGDRGRRYTFAVTGHVPCPLTTQVVLCRDFGRRHKPSSVSTDVRILFGENRSSPVTERYRLVWGI